MTRLLDRYVAGQFLTTFLVLVLGLPFLFVIVDVTDNLDKYLARGLDFSSVALSYLYQLPLFILWSFPIAALIGTVFTIGGLTRHQEIAAAKAGGVSFYRVIAPIVVLAAVLSGGALVLGEIVPVTNRMRAELLGESRSISGSVRTNFVFQTQSGQVISARRLETERKEMTRVTLETEGSAEAPGVHGTAERARWSAETGWTMEQGFLRLLGPGGVENTFAFSEMRLPEMRETPEELMAEPKEPEEMTYAEMNTFIEAIRRSGGDPRPLVVERDQKIALPVAVLVIVLFGAPLATSSRRGGAAYGIGISLAVTIVYLMLFKVGKAVGSSGGMDPLLAAWMPNMLFFAAAMVLLYRVRT